MRSSSPRRRDPYRFLGDLKTRWPEFARVDQPIAWMDVLAIAQRERIHLRVRDLPPQQKARLLRVGSHVFMQVNHDMSRAEQTVHAVHELVHFVRDDPGVACYYSDEITGGEACAFADLIAWMATSPARHFVPGIVDPQYRLPFTWRTPEDA